MSELKAKVAKAALSYLEDEPIFGVGTGSTVNYLIDELVSIRHRLEGCVASSVMTERRLRSLGIPVIDLNAVNELPLYIDSADEVTANGLMIKGGGAALTREKIVATAAKQFLCIIDESKLVRTLGVFPIAVEVIPMARSLVAREIVRLGGSPCYREGVVTDNGHIILDVFHLNLQDPLTMEKAIKQLPGVIESGLFAARPANQLLIAGSNGIESRFV